MSAKKGQQAVIGFTANYTNRVDKKGRVSVPAQFRALLADSSFPGLFVYESFILPCLEAATHEYMDALTEKLATEYGPYDEDYQAFAVSIIGAAHALNCDGEGRILLPHALLEFARISDAAVFVGCGETLQIWEPEAWAGHRDAQRRIARERVAKLGPIRSRRRPAGEEAGHGA